MIFRYVSMVCDVYYLVIWEMYFLYGIPGPKKFESLCCLSSVDVTGPMLCVRGRYKWPSEQAVTPNNHLCSGNKYSLYLQWWTRIKKTKRKNYQAPESQFSYTKALALKKKKRRSFLFHVEKVVSKRLQLRCVICCNKKRRAESFVSHRVTWDSQQPLYSKTRPKCRTIDNPRSQPDSPDYGLPHNGLCL